jgi:hypothetical protein
MYVGWTKHLQHPTDKERFELQITGSKPVLEIIKTLIEEQIIDTDKSETSERQFDNPSWPYLQAYKNGFRAGLMIIHKFVDLDSQKGINDRRPSEPSGT